VLPNGYAVAPDVLAVVFRVFRGNIKGGKRRKKAEKGGKRRIVGD
jgi:hypothetical protein